MRRLLFVPAVVLGSFCVYCGQSAVSDTGLIDGGSSGGDGTGGGFVKDARADTCCTPPAAPAPKFTKLAEGELTYGPALSAPIAVGAYREVVIYTFLVQTPTFYGNSCVVPLFRADATSPFGATGSGTIGRIAVQGPDMALRFATESCDRTARAHYVVAGVE